MSLAEDNLLTCGCGRGSLDDLLDLFRSRLTVSGERGRAAGLGREESDLCKRKYIRNRENFLLNKVYS